MELPGLNPLGAMAALAVEAPARRLQQISRVAPSDGANGASTQGHQNPDQGSGAAEARDISALREAIGRQSLPAGPPPAFEMNLLEAEGGLDQALARIEVTRSQLRDAPALRPDVDRPAPLADASALVATTD